MEIILFAYVLPMILAGIICYKYELSRKSTDFTLGDLLVCIFITITPLINIAFLCFCCAENEIREVLFPKLDKYLTKVLIKREE